MKVLKNIFDDFYKNHVVTLILRLSILYLILFVLQVVFYLFNKETIGELDLESIYGILRGSLIFHKISILYLNIPFLVFSLLPIRRRVSKLYQKVLLIYFLVTNSVGIVVFNLIDTIYFKFSLKRITIQDMYFLENNDNNLRIFWRVIIEEYWLIPLLIALVWIMYYLYSKIKYNEIKIINNYKYYIYNIILFVGSIYFTVILIRGGSFTHLMQPYAPMDATRYLKKVENFQQVNLILSNPFCFIRTMGADFRSITNKYYSDDTLANIFSAKHYPSEYKTGINLEGKNLVLFILESFSKAHSKLLSPEYFSDNQEGYTPFLDSLMREGYVFNQAYSNGFQSIDAMPAILASIPSYRNFARTPNFLAKIEGLPKVLLDKGYETSFFCGSPNNYLGFESFAFVLGINKIYSMEDYEEDGYEISKHTVEPLWGIFDMPFFGYMADKINDIKQPFFASCFSLTSHHPYSVPPMYKDKLPNSADRVQPCIYYTDLSIKEMFKKIRDKEWFKNTIFLFVADHVGHETPPSNSNSKRMSSIIMFFYTPDGSLKGENSSVTQQLDIMPTVLGLFGNKKPYFAMGRDVFNERDKMPISTNFIGNYYQVITDSITMYFDGNKMVSAYRDEDLKNNVLDTINDEIQIKVTKELKAILQTYYRAVENRDYIVEERKEDI